MATVYFDLPNVTNGTGTSASPKNATGWAAQVIAAGDTYLFKRGTSSAAAAFSLTSGTAGNIITWGSWYNADGTDDTTKARPILNTTSVLSTFASPKDFYTLQNLEIVSSAITVANDKALIFMGDDTTIHNCIIDTNLGVIGAWGSNNVTITNNSLAGVSHTNANTNCVLIVSEAANMDNINISQNTIRHKGGGSNNSHAVRLEATTAGTALTNLVVYGNTITTSTGSANANLGAIGLRLQRCPAADIRANTITYMLEGIFMVGGGADTACDFRFNTLINNAHFGLHLSTDCVGCLIEYNNCSFNGTSTHDGVTLFAYGRGIELTSSAGQAKCSNHTIRYNTCNNNFNWGGPNDNASEGVGIGLDDATFGCTVYGNTMRLNEGNGLQYYGGTPGSGSPAITDTGSNHVVANFFEDNCTNAVLNRRTGGTFHTLFTAHINMAVIFGSPTYVAHNVFVGATPVGVFQNVSCTLVLVTNNIFIDTPHALSFANTISTGSVNSNLFFEDASTIQKYCLGDVDGDGSPTYVTKTYTGTNNLEVDPELSITTPLYYPTAGSPVISAGFAYAASQRDFVGLFFNAEPSIGMYEFFGEAATIVPGGHMRKYLRGRR